MVDFKMTEKEYRAVPKNSSSSLKEFSLDKRKYRKRYILDEKVEDKETAASNMGQLVELLLMEPDRFDDVFFMSSCASIPSGLMGDFVQALVKHTMDATDEDGVCLSPFMDLAEKAYIDSGFKLKLETVIKNFMGSDAEVYYEELCKVTYNKMIVITPDDVNNAERIVKELQGNFVTSTVINLTDSAQFAVYNQLKVVDFEIDGLNMKAMLDKVIMDHKMRTIQFYDLKCTWNVEQFYKEYYLYRRAYIQAYTYYKACQSLTLPGSVFEGYEVLLPKFIVCDSINYYNPLIFELTEQDLKDAYEGFEVKGYKYPGVKEIISELQWSIDNDCWNMSKKNFNNNGLVKLTN